MSFVALVSKALLPLCRGNDRWQCCDLLSLRWHIFHFWLLQRRWACCDPLRHPSQFHCMSEVFMAASSGRSVGTHWGGCEVKMEQVLLAIYFNLCTVCLTSSRGGGSFAKLRSRSNQDCLKVVQLQSSRLLIFYLPSYTQKHNVKPVFLQFCPSSAKECWAAAVVWPDYFSIHWTKTK